MKRIILLIFSSVCLFSCSKTENTGFGNTDSLEGTVWEYEGQYTFTYKDDKDEKKTYNHKYKKVLRFDKTKFYSESHDVYINSNLEENERHYTSEGSYIYDPPKLTIMNLEGNATATIIGEYLQIDGEKFYGEDIIFLRVK